jgi:hypothetical protein
VTSAFAVLRPLIGKPGNVRISRRPAGVVTNCADLHTPF